MGLFIEPLSIPDVLVIRPKRHHDSRGWLMETYQARHFAAHGIDAAFVQDNAVASSRRGTVRGLHFQVPPTEQAKLVRVVRGSVFDVAVDLRSESPTYGHWVGHTLTAEGAEELLIPRGFAHGYCTLDDNTEVAYKCDDFYNPGAEGGIVYNDPTLAISWPFPLSELVSSERDRGLPTFDRFVSPFTS